MKRIISIILALAVLAFSGTAAIAAPPTGEQQGQSTQTTAQDRVRQRLEEQIRAQIQATCPCLTDGTLNSANREQVMEQLRQFATEQLRTELAAEQTDDATKAQIEAELQTKLRDMVRDQLQLQLKDGMKQQIQTRIAEKHQFRVHLAVGEYQFKNKGALRANGQLVQFDVPPVIKDGRTLVPVRALTEALGADVVYDEATNSVTVTLGDTVIMLIIGDNVIYVNGEPVTLDTQSANVDGRAVLPLRAIVENLGGDITYDDTTGDVGVTLPADGTTTQ